LQSRSTLQRVESTHDGICGLTLMTLNDPEPPKIEDFSDLLRFSAAAHILRVNCELRWNRPRQPTNRNCYRLSRVSWASA